MSDLMDGLRGGERGGDVEPFLERQLDRLGKTLFDSIDRLEEHIERRAAQVAAPRIAEAEARAAAAEQRAEQAERSFEQRQEDLRAEMGRQVRVLDRQRDELLWLAQYLPGPVREIALPRSSVLDAIASKLPEEWRARVARRATPGYNPAREAELRLLTDAITMVVEGQHGSPSMLVRKMKVDFATAQQFMQRMEDLGIVGPARGSRAREVLATPEGLPALLATVTAPAEAGGQ